MNANVSVRSLGASAIRVLIALTFLNFSVWAQVLPSGSWVYSGRAVAEIPQEIGIPFENITAIAAGYEHSAALLANGSVTSWGRNDYNVIEIPEAARSEVAAIAAGGVSTDRTGGHTLALKTDGSLIAWGRNDFGQTDIPTEAQSGVIAIAAGGHHSVALKADGSVLAWGDNAYGQTTVPEEAQSGVTAISAGYFHTIALKENGAVVEWGRDFMGSTNVPSDAQLGIIAVSAGGSHSVALTSTGRVIVWGDSSYENTTVPEDAQSGIVAIEAGCWHTLALKSDGRVVAWGMNSFGQANVPSDALSGVTAISGGGYHSMALKENGEMVIWGEHYSGQGVVPSALQANIVSVAASSYHRLALNGDGSLVAWGRNDEGQTTIPLEAQSEVAAIAAGNYHSVVLKEDGSVVAWGSNSNGQTTVPNEAKSGVSAMAAGGWHTCALKNGGVIVWGNASYNITTVPLEAQSGVLAVAAGGWHTIALKDNGGVVAWGLNLNGATDVPIDAQSNVNAIATGGSHNLALKSDGRVIAWGNNQSGQSTVPLAAQSGVVAIAAGSSHSLALKQDGSVVTWGANLYGETILSSEALYGVTHISAGESVSFYRIKGVAEIAVEQPAGIDLTSGVSEVPFIAPDGGSKSLDITIKSVGTTSLGEISASVGGVHASDFAITSPPAGTVDVGNSTTLTVTFTPRAAGNRTAMLSIVSNDSDEKPFTITLLGKSFSETNDGDGDGLSDYDEVVLYGTNPAISDTDADGLTDGWEIGVGRFSIIEGSFSWAQARADAHVRGGELACFPSEDRWKRAMHTLGTNALDSYLGLWIGASDEATDGVWLWVNGEQFSFSQWAMGRPSATTGNTLDYVEVSGGDGAEIGKWYDRSASSLRDGYILETGYATNPKLADADNDGLNDSQEQLAGSNPFLADTDGDGLTDAQEVNLTHTNPTLPDTDGNGTGDAAEDLDNDGLNNLEEISQYATDPLDDDSDNDGLKDGYEVNYAASFFKLVQGIYTYPQAAADAASKRGRVASFPDVADYSRMAYKARQTTQGYLWIGLTDAASEGAWVWTDGTTATYSRWLDGEPSGAASENHVVIMENSTSWADTSETYLAAGYLFERVGLDPLNKDTDGDGLLDGQEVNTTNSSPVLDDTDGDGLLDGAEVNTHGSSPLLADTDEDGLNDRVEVEVYGSNPSLKDSDGDGFEDLFEVNTGFNPALATSTPDALSSIRTAVEFRFNAANGVSYRIEASTDLNQWETIETDIIGQSSVVTRFYSIENQPRRYFRVRRN